MTHQGPAQEHADNCYGPAIDGFGVCDNCGRLIEPGRSPFIPPPEALVPGRVRWASKSGDLPEGRLVDRGLSEERRGHYASGWEELDR